MTHNGLLARRAGPVIAKAEKGDAVRSHGFHEWGEYQKQIEMTGVAGDD